MYTKSSIFYSSPCQKGSAPFDPPTRKRVGKASSKAETEATSQSKMTGQKRMTKTKIKGEKQNLKIVRNFRLTEADAAAWDEKVNASGMSASAFFREAVLQNKTVVQASKKQSTLEQRKILFLFAQQSNNINQIAHRLNSDHRAGKVTSETYKAILAELQGLSQMAKGWVA